MSNSIADNCFFSVDVIEHIVLMPCFIGNIKKGLYERLNQRILEYSPELQGVFVTFSDVCILQNTGEIHEDDPHVHFDIKYKACIFQPPLGAVVKGIVNKVGEDYFTCLVCGCFTVLVVLESGKYNSSVLSSIEEDKEVNVCITTVPSSGENLTLNGELYVEDSCKRKKGKKRNRDFDTCSEVTTCIVKKKPRTGDSSPCREIISFAGAENEDCDNSTDNKSRKYKRKKNVSVL